LHEEGKKKLERVKKFGENMSLVVWGTNSKN